MSIFSHTSINLGEVLFDNELRQSGVTISYSGSTSLEFAPENVIDWRDFSLFSADDVGTATLDFTMLVDTDISSLSTFVAE